MRVTAMSSVPLPTISKVSVIVCSAKFAPISLVFWPLYRSCSTSAPGVFSSTSIVRGVILVSSRVTVKVWLISWSAASFAVTATEYDGGSSAS